VTDLRITFRPLRADDFVLLGRWLAEPHVARWWNHDPSPSAVERDFGPTLRGEEPAEDFLALLEARPFGLVQRCRLADYPDERAAFEAIAPVPEQAVILDYLIGDPAQVGQGLGPAMIRALVDRTWRDRPATQGIIVAVVAANRASWRALEKAGFTRIGEGDITPDNPIDDPLHYVYRRDPPAGAGGAP
jgi:aminoglycoside 6'-N-acetyltransferase